MPTNIRNFCIIAHIDHGKSTLADRFLEYTGTVEKRELKAQLLDDMDLEIERGITIKNHAIQMSYSHSNATYTLNLIDTPGHVDFSYEVSRSIATCEGALLVIDAAQGIQAQTISNLYLAIDNNLTIIPVLNKVDLPSARTEEVKDEIISLLGCKESDIIEASAKTGLGIKEILHEIVTKIPPPQGQNDKALQALIFDSIFDIYRGVIVYFKIVNGTIKKNDKIKFIATEKEYIAEEIGILKLEREAKNELTAGDVGYLIAGAKTAKEVKVGDTITHTNNPGKLIEGFKEVKPLVFAGIYPINSEHYELLKESMLKLQLNDASLSFQPESSVALGFGLRCGFLGMLHLEIVQERIEREFNIDVIITAPNVSYTAYTTKNEIITVNNPSELPEQQKLNYIEEPFIRATIITKSDFIGKIMSLCIEKRGVLHNQNYLTIDRVELVFEMPMAEIVFDFYDKLKTISKGYASFDYEIIDYKKSDLVRVDIKINSHMVDALSSLVHKSNAYTMGKKICEKLKGLLPRQQFEIAIQAAIGAKIIARENVKALRKDVTAKCYGGDITRKRKLLEKQKKGKKRMRQVGNVEIPQSAFMSVLKLD